MSSRATGTARATFILAHLYLALSLGAFAGLLSSAQSPARVNAAFLAGISIAVTYMVAVTNYRAPRAWVLAVLVVTGPLFMGKPLAGEAVGGPAGPKWADGVTQLWFIAVWALLVACFLGWRANRTRQVRGLGRPSFNAPEMARLAEAQQVFGTAGSVGRAGNIFGEANAAAGERGEIIAASLLEEAFRDVPGAYIFHGLRFPGSVRADVDHAVLVGNRVAFIDAKAWKAGHYTWSRGGVILRDGAPFEGGNNHMDSAVSGFRRKLPRNARARGWVMLVSTGSRSSITVDNRRARGIDMGTGDTVVANVKEWLMAGDNPQTLNLQAFAVLHMNLINVVKAKSRR